MLRLTRLGGTEVFINADLIATVEAHQATVVTLVDGSRHVVAETPARIVELMTAYRAAILALADTVDAEQPPPRPEAAAEPRADPAAPLHLVRGGRPAGSRNTAAP